MIKINVDKAKEIQKNMMRVVRKPLLEKLDVDFVKALEIGSDLEEIKIKKQELRDVTNLVTEAEITGTTIDEVTSEIKSIWDETLLGPKPY